MATTRVIAVADHPRRPRRIAFDIDFATGAIGNAEGAGLNPADMVARLRRQHDTFDGEIWFPWNEGFAAKPPLTDPRSLAWLLLADGFRLEGDLARYPAPAPTPLPPGVFG